MWELDCEEGWAPKNWCVWTVVLEKTLESPLDCKEIQPVHPKGDQSWVFIGRNDAKAETPVLWIPHVKSWFIGKDSDARRDWGQEEKGTTEDEIAGWHHWLNGRESEWTPGVGDGQGGLACCNSWDHKESDTTERLNWNSPLLPINLNHPSDFFSFPCWNIYCKSVFKKGLFGLRCLKIILILFSHLSDHLPGYNILSINIFFMLWEYIFIILMVRIAAENSELHLIVS